MTTLDRLRQPHPGREHQGRTPPLSRRLRVPIDLTNRPSIDRPSITDPGHAPPARCALARLRHYLRRDLILRRPKAPRHHKTSRPVLAQTSPTRAHPALRGVWISSLRTLFLTNDQKASTSTSLRCRSWTRTSVSVLGGHPEPSANGFIFVAGDLLSGAQAPPTHHHQQGARHFRNASDTSPCPG
jgi:hypothetical protein